MEKIEVKLLSENFIEAIGKEWMLVTSGSKESFNTMTASWGGVGYLWNKPVVYVFIRPERYTFEFTEVNDFFTLSFLGEEHKAVHKVCGSQSGRYVDKIKDTGLVPLFTEKGNVTFEQSRLTLECKKLYSTDLKKEEFIDPELFDKWYDPAHGGLHKVYIAEITDVWIR